MPAKKIDGDDQLGTPRAEHRGHADAGVARSLGKRRQGRKAGAAPDGDNVAPVPTERKSDAERAHDVETVTGFQSVQSARAGARDLVKKFHLALGGIGAIDTHRAPQERLLAGGLWAKQLKELAQALPRPRYRCSGLRGGGIPH